MRRGRARPSGRNNATKTGGLASKGDQQSAVIPTSIIDAPMTVALRIQLTTGTLSLQGNRVIDLEGFAKGAPEFAAFASLYQQCRITRAAVDIQPLSRYNWSSAAFAPPSGYDVTQPTWLCYVAPGGLSSLNTITNMSSKLFNRDDPMHAELSPAPLVGTSSRDIPWVPCSLASADTYGTLYLNNLQTSTPAGVVYPTGPVTLTLTIQFRLRT